jgi:phage protein U
MLAKLDNYTFKLFENEIDEVSESLNYHYAEHKRLNNHSSLQDVNKHSHGVVLKGLLVQQKMNTLDALEELANKKDKVRYTTKNDDFFVVIKSIQKGKTLYNKDGSFMVQSYNCKLKRVWR